MACLHACSMHAVWVPRLWTCLDWGCLQVTGLSSAPRINSWQLAFRVMQAAMCTEPTVPCHMHADKFITYTCIHFAFSSIWHPRLSQALARARIIPAYVACRLGRRINFIIHFHRSDQPRAAPAGSMSGRVENSFRASCWCSTSAYFNSVPSVN